MMKVLISGSTGFLGKYIVQEFERLNYVIDTIGRGRHSSIIADISKEIPPILNTYDFVVHVAGKAHSVPKTKEEKQEFYNVNHIGTKNLLNSLKGKKPKTIVFISTVAVYGKDYGEMIDESFPLLGSTPYAESKILAEQEIINFSKERNLNYIILRLPLISGINPPGNLGAMIKAIKKGYYFRIGKGLAQKSIVSSKDVAKLILTLEGKSGIYNLTDGINPKFHEIEDYIARLFNKKITAFPKWIFSILAKIGDFIPFFIIDTNKLSKITATLTFSTEKAKKELNWNPKSALNNITK
ncbi:NAD(P)-dependent oxidoreductase [Tenacibaculum finnmarkense]|nr:NAD(P)-dependent oxidoreductase [Tenacibaculum finnmarkense]MCG8718069.1 NAD(P)-dependent oxidoreductase [Tenacibaculum finnmarkense]MCG8725810.1 NAD(P)-dependent oxidoreductase [Tenacibaculum finnmarkense]MCG8728124.1 NAD(P)-dependent oxidoreductase [Tenacibaculum finnmarkense]MCG8736192.1 NAD(P)-dependent oxidoreductase [Tenacibaculum finnmarkense]